MALTLNISILLFFFFFSKRKKEKVSNRKARRQLSSSILIIVISKWGKKKKNIIQYLTIDKIKKYSQTTLYNFLLSLFSSSRFLILFILFTYFLFIILIWKYLKQRYVSCLRSMSFPNRIVLEWSITVILGFISRVGSSIRSVEFVHLIIYLFFCYYRYYYVVIRKIIKLQIVCVSLRLR